MAVFCRIHKIIHILPPSDVDRKDVDIVDKWKYSPRTAEYIMPRPGITVERRYVTGRKRYFRLY
jgi:hypothetical protein